MRKIKKNTYSL